MKTTSLIVIMFFLLNPVSVGSQKTVSVEKSLNVASDRGPEQIVVRFFEIVVQGDFEKLPEMSTNYPDEYFAAQRLEVELYSRSQGISRPSSQPTDSRDSVKMEPTLKLQNSTTADDGFTRELILRNAKEFNNSSFYIDKIVGVWVKGNEARVRTELRSRKFERQLAQRDFLLFKAKGEWRIFLIDTRSLVNVYGMSEVEYVK